jgi:hypothetical protein
MGLFDSLSAFDPSQLGTGNWRGALTHRNDGTGQSEMGYYGASGWTSLGRLGQPGSAEWNDFLARSQAEQAQQDAWNARKTGGGVGQITGFANVGGVTNWIDQKGNQLAQTPASEIGKYWGSSGPTAQSIGGVQTYNYAGADDARYKAPPAAPAAPAQPAGMVSSAQSQAPDANMIMRILKILFQYGGPGLFNRSK